MLKTVILQSLFFHEGKGTRFAKATKNPNKRQLQCSLVYARPERFTLPAATSRSFDGNHRVTSDYRSCNALGTKPLFKKTFYYTYLAVSKTEKYIYIQYFLNCSQMNPLIYECILYYALCLWFLYCNDDVLQLLTRFYGHLNN